LFVASPACQLDQRPRIHGILNGLITHESDTGSFGTSGTTLTEFVANISTGSGFGTTLDIRPALVTGLFTENESGVLRNSRFSS